MAVAVAIGLGIVGLGRSSPTAGSSLAHCNHTGGDLQVWLFGGGKALGAEEIIDRAVLAVEDLDILERASDGCLLGRPCRETGRRVHVKLPVSAHPFRPAKVGMHWHDD